MARTRGLTAIAVLTLALGIGGNTAVFTVVRSVLLRPLPYAQPERLAGVVAHLPGMGFPTAGLTEAELVALAGHPEVFEQAGAFIDWQPTLTGGEAERLTGSLVTPALLRVLGTPVALGRDFTADDGAPGAPEVAMLTHRFWKRRFGSDPSVVGRVVTLNGKPTTVIGVLPERFRHPLEVAAADPIEIVGLLHLNPADPRKVSHFLETVVRLAPGVDLKKSGAFLGAEGARLAAADPQLYPASARFSLTAIDFRTRLVGDVSAALWILFGAVCLVLLIACANVANLLLARGEVRQREIAVRLALGAAPGRLVRQLLTESVLLAVVGGAAGILVAHWALQALLALAPRNLPRLGDIQLDAPVLLFSSAVSLGTGLVFGLVPSLRLTSSRLHDTLKQGGGAAGTSVQKGRLSRLLVVAEMALALTVLVGAGLLLKSFWRLRNTETGLHAGSALTLRLTLPRSTYPDGERVWNTWQTLQSRLESLPGVERVAAVEPLPMTGNTFDTIFHVEGRPFDTNKMIDAELKFATPSYFEVVGQRALRGRAVLSNDNLPGAPPVVTINQTLARMAFPDEEPLGKRIQLLTDPGTKNAYAEIVGVLADAKNTSLAGETRPEIYIPHLQAKRLVGLEMRWMSFVLRSKGSLTPLIPAVRAELRAVDPDLAVSDLRTFDDVIKGQVAHPRFNLLLIGAFALIALALGTVGIYGVVATWVARRTRELGVRIALGAGRRQILALVLSQGTRMLGAGVIAGLLLSAAVSRVLSSLLYQVNALDPAIFAGVAALLLAAGLLSLVLPALRATRVDPMESLRAE